METKEVYAKLPNSEVIRKQICQSPDVIYCKDDGSKRCPRTCGLYQYKKHLNPKEKGLPKRLK